MKHIEYTLRGGGNMRIPIPQSYRDSQKRLF